MTFKKAVIATLTICITAILWVALCGCEDLGAYNDVSEYYGAFVDPITGLELPRVVFTVTNLLVRALEVKSGDEAEGDN